jgi:hypothetical protein
MNKKRACSRAFAGHGPVAESQRSFKVAKTMMASYGKSIISHDPFQHAFTDHSLASGDYKFSERVRNIVEIQGMDFFNRKCTKLVARALDNEEDAKSASFETFDDVPGCPTRRGTADGEIDQAFADVDQSGDEDGEQGKENEPRIDDDSKDANRLSGSSYASSESTHSSEDPRSSSESESSEGLEREGSSDRSVELPGSPYEPVESSEESANIIQRIDAEVPKQINGGSRIDKQLSLHKMANGEKELDHFKMYGDLNDNEWDPEDPNRYSNDDPNRQVHGFEYQSPPSITTNEKGYKPKQFPDYIEPDPSELDLIAEDIFDFGTRNNITRTSTYDSSASASASTAETIPSSPESIVNFRPLNQKPSFKFTPSSSIASKLPEFLASMKAANDTLQADIAAGRLGDHLLEIDDATQQERGDERPYVEMDLGLGVLEETTSHISSSDNGVNEPDVATRSIIDAALQKSTSGKKSVAIEEL